MVVPEEANPLTPNQDLNADDSEGRFAHQKAVEDYRSPRLLRVGVGARMRIP